MLVVTVVPGSNADRSGLKSGDVVISYAGTKLAGPADLVVATRRREGLSSSAEPPGTAGIPLTVWRDGPILELTVRPGPLGVGMNERPATEAILAARDADALLARARGEAPPPLPGTRREVQAIAPLFAHAEILLGTDASEQRLDQLATSGQLRTFDILHLATHGRLQPEVAMQSAPDPGPRPAT